MDSTRKGKEPTTIVSINYYQIKLYDKAQQHHLGYELLRYEIHFTSEMLKKSGIYKVADILTNKEQRIYD
jgi:hypothetical protein